MPLYPPLGATVQAAQVPLGTLTAGSTDYPITWPAPWPDALYTVAALIEVGAVGVGKVEPNLKAGTRTTTGCTITVTNALLVSLASGAILHVVATE